MGVLAALGLVMLMGPAYLVVPALRAVLLLVAAVALRRRWAEILLIVLEAVSVVGFWLSLAVGLTPWVDYPLNLVGLLTNLVLPGLVLYLAVWLLAHPAARAQPPHPPVGCHAAPLAGPLPVAPAGTLVEAPR
jgi:hypothetical protein